ncbi:MAG: DeoR/GlpR transcriptional regulator [Clostridia bacterium]|nr:DeoR/GlpR transcriptional regulator [Clostridia bacterium]
MLAKERQRCICELINNNGSAKSMELMELFDVSLETIRKDLLILERQGALTRVHGGAIKADRIKPFYAFQQRITENGEQKEKLAQKAVEFIAEGDVIGIDTGSTALFLAAALKERFSELTIITHSLDAFNELHGVKSFKVILCGGQFSEDERAFYGALTLNMLENLHMNKVFVFPTGISLESGLTDYQYDLLPIQKQYITSAESVYILADSSKFQKKALYRIFEMKRAFTYVTDDGLPDEIKELYKENQYNII